MAIIGFCVAGLTLWIDARDSHVKITFPPSHGKFLRKYSWEAKAGVDENDRLPGDLILKLKNEPKPQAKTWGSLLCRNEIWELWRCDDGDYVFYIPGGLLAQRVRVDPTFTKGDLVVDGSNPASDGFYPLQALDIRIYASWLANYGDVILHAAAVAIDGRGYCFAGQGGAGKSTLAASLSARPDTAILGEDQVVLRRIDGQYWIFGAPWHSNPAMCSPVGVPVEKIFFLENDGRQNTATCTPTEGVTRILQTAFIPYYRTEAMPAILDRLAGLAKQASFFTLGYRLGSDVYELIRQA